MCQPRRGAIGFSGLGLPLPSNGFQHLKPNHRGPGPEFRTQTESSRSRTLAAHKKAAPPCGESARPTAHPAPAPLRAGPLRRAASIYGPLARDPIGLGNPPLATTADSSGQLIITVMEWLGND